MDAGNAGPVPRQAADKGLTNRCFDTEFTYKSNAAWRFPLGTPSPKERSRSSFGFGFPGGFGLTPMRVGCATTFVLTVRQKYAFVLAKWHGQQRPWR